MNDFVDFMQEDIYDARNLQQLEYQPPAPPTQWSPLSTQSELHAFAGNFPAQASSGSSAAALQQIQINLQLSYLAAANFPQIAAPEQTYNFDQYPTKLSAPLAQPVGYPKFNNTTSDLATANFIPPPEHTPIPFEIQRPQIPPTEKCHLYASLRNPFYANDQYNQELYYRFPQEDPHIAYTAGLVNTTDQLLQAYQESLISAANHQHSLAKEKAPSNTSEEIFDDDDESDSDSSWDSEASSSNWTKNTRKGKQAASSSKSDRVECIICNKSYRDVYNLKRHMRDTHDTTRDKYVCECGSVFVRKDNLKQHQSTKRHFQNLRRLDPQSDPQSSSSADE